MCFTVQGGFSEWMEWGACSVSCGTGVQKRLRQCNNPFPANGGRHCIGSATETRSCQGKPCPGKLVCHPFCRSLHCEHLHMHLRITYTYIYIYVYILGVARYTDVTVRYVPRFGCHGSIRFRYNRKKTTNLLFSVSFHLF